MDISEVVITSARDTTDSDLSFTAWKWDTGEKVNKYRGGGYCVGHGLATSGGYVLAADERRPLVHAWTLNANQCGSAGQLLASRPRCLAATKDLGYIAIGAEDSIQLYQMGTGRLAANFGSKFQPPTCAKFSSEDCLLACAASDGVITVWSVGTLLAQGDLCPEPLFVFEGHRLPVADLLFTSGGLRSKLVSVSPDRTCKIHDLISGTMISSVIYNTGLSAVALHHNENHLFIGNKTGEIHVLPLDLVRGPVDRHLATDEQNRLLFSGHFDEVTSLSISNHRPLLASGSRDGTVKIWDVVTLNCLRTLEHNGPVTNVLFELVSDSVFEKSFKPVVPLPHHCVPYEINSRGDDKKPEEVTTLKDLLPDVLEVPEVVSGPQGTGSKEEIGKLRSINEALYMFSIKRILNKTVRYETSCEDQEKTQIVNVDSRKQQAKPNKKRKRNKNKQNKTSI